MTWLIFILYQSFTLSPLQAENRLSSLQKQVSDSTARVEEMEEELEEAERKARTTTVELVNARSEISTLGLQHSQATLRVSECDRQIQGLQTELLRYGRQYTFKIFVFLRFPPVDLKRLTLSILISLSNTPIELRRTPMTRISWCSWRVRSES